MEQCYRLSLDGSNPFANYLVNGRKEYEQGNLAAQKLLQELSRKPDTLNATELATQWFNLKKSDVFISHSHKDVDIATGLAEYLRQFNITSFVDSCVWGNADNLLKILDDEFCREGPFHYNYDGRNCSTGHVHILLSTALSEMIDRCTYVVFLDTPNFQMKDAKSAIKDRSTSSAWIYHEIFMTKLLAKQHYVALSESERSKLAQLKITYDFSLDHAEEIELMNLESWAKGQMKRSRTTSVLTRAALLKRIDDALNG